MSFREKFLQQDAFRKEIVTIPGIGDAEIREINSQQRSMIYRAATITRVPVEMPPPSRPRPLSSLGCYLHGKGTLKTEN